MPDGDSIKPRVLIVDDSPDCIDLLVEALSDEYAVVVAKNGAKALTLAENQTPDLILLDVRMPIMDGYEVCRVLKANPLTRRIPVLFVTGQSDHDDERKGLELGAVDYITKPFQPDLVKARVRNHLELSLYRNQLEMLVK